MRKLLLFAGCVIMHIVYAQDNVIRVKSILKEVTIFYNQAQLKHHTSIFQVPQGQHTIIIENVATSLIPSSIQIRGKGNFIILSSEFKLNYIQSKTISRQIQQIEDSLEYFSNKKSILDIQINSYNDEEHLLLANKSIGGQNTGVSTTELEKMANFYRARLNDIRTKKLELQPKIKKYQEQIDKLKKQLEELNGSKNTASGEIEVVVYANTLISNAELDLEYLCNHAEWIPEYEIRVNDINKPLSLLLKAQVRQHTGIDWKNIKLNLSTSNPLLNNNKPELVPWWLILSDVNNQATESYKYKTLDKPRSKEHNEDILAPFGIETSVSKEITRLTYQEYSLEASISIESNSKKYVRVDIQNYELAANYVYYTAPSINKFAYLLAQIPDWTKYHVLDATAYIFIENSFVGTSFINSQTTKDTMDISLGIDKNISIKREMIKKYNEKKIIGNTRKETRGYEISIKNKKKNSISIIVEDQIPLSSLQEIEVDLLEHSNAIYDKVSGKLQWKLDLAPDEEKKLQFKYSVKYPKDKIIINH